MRVLLFLCIFLAGQGLFAQEDADVKVGIFETYQDYLDDKVQEKEGPVIVGYGFNGKFYLVFGEGKSQEKVNLDVKKHWGYRSETGEVFRITHKSRPYLIFATTDDLVLYLNWTAKIYKGDIIYDERQYVPYISKGLGAEMYSINKKNMQKVLEGNDAALNKFNNTKKNSGLDTLIKFSLDYITDKNETAIKREKKKSAGK